MASTHQMSTTELLTMQSDIGTRIEDMLNAYPKGNIALSRIPTIMIKLGTLDSEWVKFLLNHEEIKSRADIDGGHDYFKEDYYGS